VVACQMRGCGAGIVNKLTEGQDARPPASRSASFARQPDRCTCVAMKGAPLVVVGQQVSGGETVIAGRSLASRRGREDDTDPASPRWEPGAGQVRPLQSPRNR